MPSRRDVLSLLGRNAAGLAAVSALGPSLARAQAAEPDIYKGHGMAMHGAPKYPADFKHFEYVNPAAPKGGAMYQGAAGATFDSLNPFILKGSPVTAVLSFVFDTLMKSSADEPFTMYGLIAKTIEKRFPAFDLLLFGKASVGADNALVPTMVAEMLGLPQANAVIKLAIEGAAGTAEREIEGAAERVSFSLPAVVSAQKGLNEPRYETLKGIMAAKKKVIPVVTLDELGLGGDAAAPQVEVVRIEMPPARQAGKIIPGTPEEAAKALAELLRSEAKVI